MNDKKPLYSRLIYPVCKYMSKDIIKEMKDETLASTKDRLERGFRICSSTEQLEKIDNKNTVMSEKCIGTESCMSMVGECPPSMKPIAFFHTHPKTHLAYPSLGDIIHTDIHDYKFLCIGGKEDNRCIVRCMPPDVPVITPQTHKIELDRFIRKWKEEVKDCIINI